MIALTTDDTIPLGPSHQNPPHKKTQNNKNGGDKASTGESKNSAKKVTTSSWRPHASYLVECQPCHPQVNRVSSAYTSWWARDLKLLLRPSRAALIKTRLHSTPEQDHEQWRAHILVSYKISPEHLSCQRFSIKETEADNENVFFVNRTNIEELCMKSVATYESKVEEWERAIKTIKEHMHITWNS